MTKYISHYSALKYWNIPLANQYYQDKIAKFGDSQFLVLNRTDRYSHQGRVPFVCTKTIPLGGVLQTNKTGIVSLPLVFLQLSQKMDILNTIVLGNILCSHSNGPNSPIKTNQNELYNFVNSAKGFCGRRKSLRALQYIQNGACSIMEIFLAMLLKLPYSLGGIGLKGGNFNFEIILDRESSRAIKKNRLYVDYCFPKEKIAYEYLGEYHETTIDQDSIRNMTLRRIGYEVIPITKSQLYNEYRLKQFLDNAAVDHGKRIQFHNNENKYLEMQRKIRNLLPRKAINN